MDESLFATLEENGPVPEFRSMRQWHVLTCLITLALAGTSVAGPFRKNKPDPEIHVPGLLNVLKNEKDEKKRAEAADELGEFDGKAFPAILPALIEAMTSDPSSTVRAEAAESIANVRPMSQKAAYALEQAAANDKSFPVRLTAKTSLLHYRLLGYTGSKTDSSVAQTAEPPLAALSTDSVRPSPSGSLIRPAPTNPTAPPSSNMPLPIPQTGPREPSNNTSMFPFLNRLNPFSRSTPPPAPVVVKDKSQTGEPPISRPTAPAPKKDFLVEEPPVTPKGFVPPAMPIPSTAKPKTVLTSDPKELPPELSKPAIQVPAVPEDPKKVPAAPAKPVLEIPPVNTNPVIQTIPNSPVSKPVPGTTPPDDGPLLPAPPPK